MTVTGTEGEQVKYPCMHESHRLPYKQNSVCCCIVLCGSCDYLVHVPDFLAMLGYQHVAPTLVLLIRLGANGVGAHPHVMSSGKARQNTPPRSGPRSGNQ